MGCNGLAQSMILDNNMLLRRFYELGAFSKETAVTLAETGIDFELHNYALEQIDFERLYGNVGRVGNRYYLKRPKRGLEACQSIYKIVNPKNYEIMRQFLNRGGRSLPAPEEGPVEGDSPKKALTEKQ